MGKNAKKHRAKVKKRNIRKELAAYDDWNKIEAVLKKRGYNSVEEALEKEPNIAPIIAPFALRAWEFTQTNIKKYGG